MKLLYVIKHRIAEYLFTGKGLFVWLIAMILSSTFLVTFIYGILVESVYLPQSTDREYRELLFYNCKATMNSNQDFYELLDLCKACGPIEQINIFDSEIPINNHKEYNYTGNNSLALFEEEFYFRKGRSFFEESEIDNADDICIILSRNNNFEIGECIYDETGTYTIIGTIRPLQSAVGNEYAYTVILPYTTFLNRIGIPDRTSVIYKNQIGIENEKKLVDYIKKLYPILDVYPSAQSYISQNSKLEMAVMFFIIFLSIIAMAMAVDYFDQKNISNDSVLRLVGAEKSDIVICSFITRILVIMMPVSFALLLHWIFITKMQGTISFADKILHYRTGDYLTIAAMIFASACLTLLPYTVKIYIRSARELAAKRE